MDWSKTLLLLALAYCADGYSKYGRTCKDIGCLNSEVCVLAEDPCSLGHTRECGTYPTCKKKSQVGGGSQAEPAAHKPIAPAPRPRPSEDDPPSYNPPAPPSGGHSPYGGSTYGGSSNTGGLPYGGTNNGGGSPYGGAPYGGLPYGGQSNGGGSPYGGSPYGGPSNGGGSPYSGPSNGGGSPYSGPSNGGGSPYSGPSNGGGSPYGRPSNGGGSPYGGPPYAGTNGGGSSYGGGSYNGGNSPYNSQYGGGSHGGSSYGGTATKSALDTVINTISKYANGGGGQPGQASGGSGLSSIFGNLLANLGNGAAGVGSGFNTRPIQENPNYSSYSSNSRSSNPQTYPSGYQQNSQPQKNYGQTHNSATRSPYQNYGWNVSVTMVFTYLMHQYIKNVINT